MLVTPATWETEVGGIQSEVQAKGTSPYLKITK
jgi:hypothetical protein